MKFFIILSVFFFNAFAYPSHHSDGYEAPYCNAADCKLPECLCSSINIPGGLKPNDTPQFVLLTFDDGVTVDNIDYYREIFSGPKNPNNCSISATFFTTHQYTDYSLVHELHANGHEIALHSITHYPDIFYWANASVDTLKRELFDQRAMMEKFALIPGNEVKGLRMPFLQMAGNRQFQMMNDNGLEYDLSWPTRVYRTPGLWPYTMKYRTIQDCPIGICPNDSFKNVWVIPMIQWDNDDKTHTCSMIDACVNKKNDTFEWMKREFLKHYNGNRAPFGVYLHAAWFKFHDDRYQEYIKFVNYLESLPDVYMNSASQVLNWVKSPKTVAEMKKSECHPIYIPKCEARKCFLQNEQNEERIITLCSSCPNRYPWLGNPLGQ